MKQLVYVISFVVFALQMKLLLPNYAHVNKALCAEKLFQFNFNMDHFIVLWPHTLYVLFVFQVVCKYMKIQCCSIGKRWGT